MAGLLLSGPPTAGKSQAARAALTERLGLSVIVDFNSLLVALSLTQALPTGRYPERDPRLGYLLPIAEYLRRAALTAARQRGLFILATNSDGDLLRRQQLLSLIGDGATETVLDPGFDEITRRLSVDGEISDQCRGARDRWYGRL